MLVSCYFYLLGMVKCFIKVCVEEKILLQILPFFKTQKLLLSLKIKSLSNQKSLHLSCLSKRLHKWIKLIYKLL